MQSQDASARRWFHFNDEHVVPMRESELQSAAGTSDHADVRRACAYMLLYRRKDPPSSSRAQQGEMEARALQEEREAEHTQTY